MTAVPRPSPGRRFPRHCVVVHDLQLGPHTCAQSCYACPDLTAALCTRCHCANLRANTRAVSRHRPGRTRCANAPPPPPHPPAWTSFPKAGAAAGAAAGAQGFVTRAVARADERKRQGGDRRVEFEVRRALWDEGFFAGLCRVFFRNIEDHHVLVQKGAENTSSLHGCA